MDWHAFYKGAEITTLIIVLGILIRQTIQWRRLIFSIVAKRDYKKAVIATAEMRQVLYKQLCILEDCIKNMKLHFESEKEIQLTKDFLKYVSKHSDLVCFEICENINNQQFLMKLKELDNEDT